MSPRCESWPPHSPPLRPLRHGQTFPPTTAGDETHFLLLFHDSPSSFSSFRSKLSSCCTSTMPVVVVTITQPASAFTAPPTSPPPSLSPDSIAGIIIGTLLGGLLLIALVIYLLRRYSRHRFTRVANPAHDAPAGADLRYLPSTGSRRTRLFTRLEKPSISSEPLMSPISWPPRPATSRVASPDTPPRLDLIFPGDSPQSSFDFGEIHHLTSPGTLSRATILPSGSPRPSLSHTPPSTPPRTMFLHRGLKSRAQVSDDISLTHRPSLDFSHTRSTTLDPSGVRAEEEQLAERTARRDAEIVQKGEDVEMAEGEVGWEDGDTAESIYSQVSAPVDHAGCFSESTNGSSSVPRRRSSRKQLVPSTELPPLTEMLSVPVFEDRTIVRPVSIAGDSSLDGRLSHETAPRPISLEGAFPLLTSVNFGKDSTKSGTSAGSISSTNAWGSRSSGRTSRYPSLAPSSLGLTSRSETRVNDGPDWHHPPSGLAGLTSLQVEPLRNPHSPAEERPMHPDVLLPGLAPVKRAHLRQSTAGSVPEVEKRDVMQAGIARIDVLL